MYRDFGLRKSRSTFFPFRGFISFRQGIADCHLKSAEKNDFLVTLRRLAERNELLPDRIRMTEKIAVSDDILAFGVFGDVRSQTYKGQCVAARTVRVPEPEDFRGTVGMTIAQKEKMLEQIRKIRKVKVNGIFAPTHGAFSTVLQRFYREVVLWSTLSHPNVLKLLGAQEDAEISQFVTVSEWMKHGSIMEYIEIHPANRLELVREPAFPTTSFAQTQQ